MDKLYTWIYWQGKFFVNLACLYGPHLLISSFIQYKGRGWVKVYGGIVFFSASFEHHFIRVHENLVHHPSNNISVIIMIHRRTWLDTLAALDDTHNQLNHPVLWYDYGWHTGLLWLKSSTKLCVHTHTYIRLSSPGAHTHTHIHTITQKDYLLHIFQH